MQPLLLSALVAALDLRYLKIRFLSVLLKKNKENLELKFEEFALSSVNVTRNTARRRFPSDARRAKTNKKYSNVEPDGITFATVPLTNGQVRTYQKDDYQPLGYIDYLTEYSEAGDAARSIIEPHLRPTPTLIYLTVADTIIGNTVIADATKEKVALFQHVLCNNTKGKIGVDDLIMGKGIPLNLSVFTGRAPLTLNPLPQGRAGTLSNPSLDLTLLFDTTLSMDDDLYLVKNSALELVNQLFSDIPSARVAIADYRDFPNYPYGSSGDYPYQTLLPFSDDPTSIIGAINRLSVGRGGDEPESAYSALINTIQGVGTGEWREDAEKAVIIFTDAPPHDPEPFTGYTAQSVINAAQNPVTIQSFSSTLTEVANSAIPSANANLGGNVNSTTKPVSIYSVVLGGSSSAVDYFSQISQETGGKLYTSPDIVKSFFDVLEDITEDLTEPDIEPQPVPEATPIWGLLMLSRLFRHSEGKCVLGYKSLKDGLRRIDNF